MTRSNKPGANANATLNKEADARAALNLSLKQRSLEEQIKSELGMNQQEMDLKRSLELKLLEQ